MPVPVPNGLLPGRGPAGRAGRGASSPAAGSAAVAGSAVAAAAGADGASTGAAGTGAGGAGGVGSGSATATGAAVTDSAAASAAGAAAAAFLAAGLRSGFSGAGGMASRSLRTTGASTVDEADLTNSPSSWSLARTSLLDTPSSLASSWTRTFDTFLLSWSGRGAPDRQCRRCMFMLACSWGVHPRITPDPLGPDFSGLRVAGRSSGVAWRWCYVVRFSDGAMSCDSAMVLRRAVLR